MGKQTNEKKDKSYSRNSNDHHNGDWMLSISVS